MSEISNQLHKEWNCEGESAKTKAGLLVEKIIWPHYWNFRMSTKDSGHKKKFCKKILDFDAYVDFWLGSNNRFVPGDVLENLEKHWGYTPKWNPDLSCLCANYLLYRQGE